MSHESSLRTYLLVFLTLMVLLALSVGIAYVDLGQINLILALTISAAKALLVMLFFMHLLHSPRLVPVVALSGLLWLSFLLVLAFADYTTRSRPDRLPTMSNEGQSAQPDDEPPELTSISTALPHGEF